MTQQISETDLRQIESRVQAARPGPWISIIEGRDQTSGESFIMVGHGDARGEDITLQGATDADQEFIAAARQDVPRLVAEVRRLRALVSKRDL